MSKSQTTLWGLDLEFDRYASPKPLNPNLLFAGQYFDEESGLAYNRFRYYDPETACYLCADPIGLLGGNNIYGYVHNPLDFIDILGLRGNPATATHITYKGIDAETGKPYIGYASMQGRVSGNNVLSYRYNNDFARFGGTSPEILYSGYGQEGKNIARGLEQRYFEAYGGLDGTANKQNPVGKNNMKRSEYLVSADKHLNAKSRIC